MAIIIFQRYVLFYFQPLSNRAGWGLDDEEEVDNGLPKLGAEMTP